MIKNSSDTQGASRQVVSRQRVVDHGEVYTSEREVGAMLDLVKDETERIDSRFLEPACGTGNFLIEVLRRKLNVVEARYSKSQSSFEAQALMAVSSLYGIDILPDNVELCRKRLFDFFEEKYRGLFKEKADERVLKSSAYILGKNIVHGDALTMKLVGKDEGICFTEWALCGGKFKGREFRYSDIQQGENPDDDLFNYSKHQSDSGESVFLANPVREIPLTNYWELYGRE